MAKQTISETQPAAAPVDAQVLAAELARVQQEIAALRQSVSATAQTVAAPAVEEKVRDLEIRLRALSALHSPADIEVQSAQRVMERLEEQRRSGGKYAWYIRNRYYSQDEKGAQRARDAGHKFYCDAKTPEAAVAEFRRRTGVQHDQSDKRGDPFEAVAIDPQLMAPPTSLKGA